MRLPRRKGTPRPPHFVGVGVYMGGGAWWRRLLRQHPELSGPPRRKGWTVNFFQRFHELPFEAEDRARYLQIFGTRDDAVRTGEWSDRYSLHPWSHPLLASVAPDAKLIYMVRDPVERFKRQAAFNFSGERAGLPVFMADAIARGRYASQLRQLLAEFPREQILVLQLEACRLDPWGEYQRTCRFLGVDPEFVPHGLEPYDGPGVEEVRFERLKRLLGRRIVKPLDLWPDIESGLLREYRAEVRQFAELVPDLDLGLWPRFADGREPARQPGGPLPEPSRRRRRVYLGWAGGGAAGAAALGLVLAALL